MCECGKCIGSAGPNLSGKCLCGCGRLTPVAKKNRPGRGYIKGEHVRYRAECKGKAKRVEDVYRVEDRGFDTPCWIWTLALTRAGYGYCFRDGRRWKAHRWMYERVVGPIPDKCGLHHLCKVPACINPEHMEPHPHAEHIRLHRAPTCGKGHPFDAEKHLHHAGRLPPVSRVQHGTPAQATGKGTLIIFYTGDIWKPEFTITDPKTKTKVDPATVTAAVTRPDRTTEAPAVTKTEVGVYTCSVPLTLEGQWRIVVTGTGSYQCAGPETITVQSD